MKTQFKIGSMATKALKVQKPNVDKIAALMDARGLREIDPEIAADRFVRYIASTESLDSVGDVVLAKGWNVDEWNSNAAIFVDHDHSVAKRVAHGLQAFVDGKNLIVDCFYLPADMSIAGNLAEACYKMVRMGLLPDCSIGALPTQIRWADKDDKAAYGDDCWRIWEAQTLKELSAVGIGANSGAKVDSVAKALTENKLTAGDLDAMQRYGGDALGAMAERALFRTAPTKSVSAPKPTADFPDSFAEAMKRIDAAAKRADAAASRLEKGAEIVRKSADGLVIPLTIEDAEAIAMHANAIGELMISMLPKPEDDDDDGSGNGSNPPPVDPFEDDTKSADGVTLNRAAAKFAQSLISSGKVDRGDKWEMTADDENALLGDGGDDWKTYAKWHLAVHSDESEKTKAHYGYPFGKGGKVYRAAVIAIKSRAAGQHEDAIENAADALLKMIDKDKENDGKGLDLAEIQRRLDAARGV